MAIYRYTEDAIQPIKETTLTALGIKERGDLQRLLREQIGIIVPETLVIAEEFGNCEESRRRIDLLAIDRDANLVVIELKRTSEIEAVIAWRKALFVSVEGSVDSTAFVTKVADSDSRFDASRWQIDDDALIRSDDRTYAFTNQWGTHTAKAMRSLIENFKPTNTSFERAT